VRGRPIRNLTATRDGFWVTLTSNEEGSNTTLGFDSDGNFLTETRSGIDEIDPLVVLPDGRQYSQQIQNSPVGFEGTALLRRNVDGTPDTTFLSSRYDLGQNWHLLGVQPDGKPIVLGRDFVTDRPKLIRLLASTPKKRVRIEWDRRGLANSSGDSALIGLLSREGSTAQLPLLRVGETTTEQRVNVTTIEGTTSAGLDFAATNVTVVLGPLAVNSSIAIPVNSDNEVEGFEYFTAVLHDPIAPAELGIDRLIVGIVDATPELHFYAPPPPFSRNQIFLHAERLEGRRVVLETSEDLRNWRSALEWRGVSSMWEVSIPTPSAESPVRFYRAIAQ
jgi:hypothetical protein